MSLEAAFKVACPSCGAVLRSRSPIAAGQVVRCPGCNQSFRTGPTTSAISTVPATQRPQSFPIDHGPVADKPPASNEARLFLAIGGVVSVGLIAAFVLWRVFSTEATPRAKAKKHEETQTKAEPQAPASPAPLIALTADEEAKVQAAVQKGLAWLKAQQRQDGSWLMQRWPEGETAMAGLVLLETGATADDPAVKKAANFLRSSVSRLTHTYSLTLAILFFDKLKDPLDEDLIRELALRLVAGQRIQGGWEYECPVLSAGEHNSLLTMLRDTQGANLAAHRRQHEETWNRVPATVRGVAALSPIPDEKDPFYFRQGGDNSNTQFALLGLWTARRHGVPVDAALERVVHRFRRSQKADGGWVYNHTTDVTSPTMTCAGLLALAVEMGMSKERKPNPADNEAVNKAFKKLAEHLGTPGSGEKAPPPTELYFLWSVERVGVPYHRPQIEDKDWYRWGASMLQRHQHPDGHWFTNLGPGTNPLTDTSFAILFLQRANLATDLTDRLRRASP
jgi:hypothetical protein